MNNRNRQRSVLFDLDGTLLDTAPDLAHALNFVLQENARDPLPLERIRRVVSHGGRALIELGFGPEHDTPDLESLRQQLLAYYQQHLSEHTRLFPGMEIVLETLASREIPWGIVTNKPGWLTEPLLRQMQLFGQAACIISGDSLPERKPHPAPLLHASTLMGIRPESCLYVGDAERDIEAGRRAGMTTLAALYGYLLEEDRPETWRADGCIRAPEELLDWL